MLTAVRPSRDMEPNAYCGRLPGITVTAGREGTMAGREVPLQAEDPKQLAVRLGR